MGPMRMRRNFFLWLGICLMTSCTSRPSSPAPAAPVDITADTSSLPENERRALAQMVRAAQLIDGLFLEQVWAGNPAMLTALAADRTDAGRAQLHYFLINKGPWDRLDH